MRIALHQTAGHPGDVAANLAEADAAAAGASAAGARLLILPEMFLTGYDIGPEIHALAEPLDGPSHSAMAATARRHGIAILYGHGERAGGATYNAARMVDAEGRPLLDYRKTHLYGAGERALYRPGDALAPVVEVESLRVGVLICYDVEFPEAVRALALAGADLVAVPTALPVPTPAVPTVLIPARAYENQIFVAYANRCGRERTLEFEGLSTVAAPDGTVLARAGAGPELLLAEIGPAAYAGSRAANPYLADRRPELYGR
ncbi:carbon-nitrogen hydrolase family protein [Arenibaculum pallidiluteum]|uniref:carbon-nitrogen hydrolase family protein n=1 Tax=Arenibaculum pallidiluteum TaxID=2812559 RepID=UPI001A976ED4|nr:carbon-nitrogen hydrolase family protein [Arenibaculum pallidiluteum]